MGPLASLTLWRGAGANGQVARKLILVKTTWRAYRNQKLDIASEAYMMNLLTASSTY
jgi:hypothetical protein